MNDLDKILYAVQMLQIQVGVLGFIFGVLGSFIAARVWKLR